MFKHFIQRRLESYVRQYFKRHPEVILVAVVGSVGKTSSKNAIATILSGKYRIRMSDKNYNSEISVPCAILGIEMPSNIRDPRAWMDVFARAKQRVREPAGLDVIIQELGTDHPGDIANFGKYLKPDVAVVTAVSPEHMEFFKTLDAVAKEELSISRYAKKVVVNRDDIAGEYAKYEENDSFVTYGLHASAEYRYEIADFSTSDGYTGRVITPTFTEGYEATLHVFGEQSVKSSLAGVAVAHEMGLNNEEVAKGLSLVQAVPGRMNVLDGLEGTAVIDDSYNSSPAAADAALRALYSFDEASIRIAVLGDMRELGEASASEHTKLGELCDPNMLAWVVTVGPDSERYLAPAARQRGCQVKVCKHAIEAAEFVRSVSEPGAVILVKGSQNTIFLEEAVRLLVDIHEYPKLVRQSESWRATKDKYFAQFYSNFTQ